MSSCLSVCLYSIWLSKQCNIPPTIWTWLLCDDYLVPLLEGFLSTWCCESYEGLGTPIIHALCYLCKTWCLGATGVTCMIPLVLTTPAFSSGCDNVESKTVQCSQNMFIKVRISCSSNSGLCFGHSILPTPTTADYGQWPKNICFLQAD